MRGRCIRLAGEMEDFYGTCGAVDVVAAALAGDPKPLRRFGVHLDADVMAGSARARLDAIEEQFRALHI